MSINIGNQIAGIRSTPGTPGHGQENVWTAEALDALHRAVIGLQRSISAINAATTGSSPVLVQQLMGTQDGVNNIFTVSATGRVMVIVRNGESLDGISATPDYTVSGGTIAFSAFSIPQPTDKLWALIWP